jgi:hypothetical protein
VGENPCFTVVFWHTEEENFSTFRPRVESSSRFCLFCRDFNDDLLSEHLLRNHNNERKQIIVERNINFMMKNHSCLAPGGPFSASRLRSAVSRPFSSRDQPRKCRTKQINIQSNHKTFVMLVYLRATKRQSIKCFRGLCENLFSR